MEAPEKHRILVVDDEIGMRDGCKKLLVSEGYEVDTAEDGQAALDRFKAGARYSVVLADLKMPRMGGIELIERIRKLDPDAVSLVITGFATIETAVEATKRGAYSYVPKPFTPEEILLPLRNALDWRALTMETDRLRAEREKRLLEVAYERSQSRTILQCMVDGVLVANREQQVVLRNAAAGCMIPGCAAMILPAPVASLGNANLVNLLTESLRAKAQPEIVSLEITLGSQTYMVNAGPVADEHAETLGAVAVLRDITARKELENAKSLFVSMVAHELKNPLAAVEGYLNLILAGVIDGDRKQMRAMLEKACLRTKTMRTMIAELLTLRAMETGRFAMVRVPLDLRALVDEVIQNFREKAQAKAIELRVDVQPPDRPAQVVGDRNALMSVTTDLLDNALKYTPEGGHVAVSLRTDCEGVHIAIQDDGMGIGAADQARIFEEFFRVRNEATAHIPGTGLGLCIVKRLVELHQGEVTVRGAPGKGSVFEVRLPVANA